MPKNKQIFCGFVGFFSKQFGHSVFSTQHGWVEESILTSRIGRHPGQSKQSSLIFFFKFVSINIFPQFAPLPPKQPFGISQISFIWPVPTASRPRAVLTGQYRKSGRCRNRLFCRKWDKLGKNIDEQKLKKKKIKLDSFI